MVLSPSLSLVLFRSRSIRFAFYVIPYTVRKASILVSYIIVSRYTRIVANIRLEIRSKLWLDIPMQNEKVE